MCCRLLLEQSQTHHLYKPTQTTPTYYFKIICRIYANYIREDTKFFYVVPDEGEFEFEVPDGEPDGEEAPVDKHKINQNSGS